MTMMRMMIYRLKTWHHTSSQLLKRHNDNANIYIYVGDVASQVIIIITDVYAESKSKQFEYTNSEQTSKRTPVAINNVENQWK